ncbi:MAG TPA: hypothetical protein VIP06_02960 [Nocardioides sp.]
MTAVSSRTNAPDRPVRIGLYVVLGACIVASGDILVEVAHKAGWFGWRGYLLPVLIDLPGFLGGRIWLRKAATTTETRSYARKLTLSTLGVSVVGNAVGHLARAGYLSPGIAMVLACSAVAPVVLWAVLHLDALLTPDAVPTRTKTKAETPVPSPAPVPSRPAEPSRPAVPVQDEKPNPSPVPAIRSVPSPPVRIVPNPSTQASDEDDLKKARALAAAYKAEHNKTITRDALKAALGCGSGKASELLRVIREEEAA